MGTISGAAGASFFRQKQKAVKNIVLVHGRFADGSGWQGVHDALKAGGYAVSVVPNPTI
jgi:hypothetical protein